MKTIKIFLGILLLTSACITVKKAPEIEDYKIMTGKSFQRKNFTDQTVFIFRNDLKMVDFRGFLANKYGLTSYKNTMRIPIHIEEIPFELHVFTPEKRNQQLNFIGAIISKDAEDITLDEEIYDYVGISVSSLMEEDCLSEDSIYHKIVIRYLENLKDEYFEL